MKLQTSGVLGTSYAIAKLAPKRESRLKIKEIAEINEIKDYLFLKFSSGESLIIPKDRIKNINELNNILTKIISDLSINHNIDLNWQWK